MHKAHGISPIDAERPSQALEQSQFAAPRFHLSASSPRLDASTTSSPPFSADSPYNLANYSSSNASSPAVSSHLSSRPTTSSSSSTVLSALAAELSHFQIPDSHLPQHLRPNPLASSSSLVFQPPPQPGVTAPKKKKTHSKPRPEGHVPRPRNPFIMFRMDVVDKKLITSENKHQNISKVVADMWKALTPKEKEPYLAAAKQEKEQHKILYPNYIYQPVGEKVVEGGRSPKRVSGSKASLKAAAAKEKRAMEDEQRRERMQRQEEDNDAEYVSSSTSKSKKRTRTTSKKSRPKASRPVSSSSNSYSDHSFEEEDADFYPDACSRPVVPIRSSSSRGGRREHSSGLSSSSFSSQGTHWESSNDEGADSQRMGMSDRGLRVGYSAGERAHGGVEGTEDAEGDELEPSLRHYQQTQETQQQPTYSYPNQQQQHYQPDDGQLTYSTYSDYPMPPQLSSSSSFPNSSIQTPSLIPFNPQLSHSSFQRPHSGGAEFLPTAPSPLTPGFPNLPTPGFQGHRRRGSSLSTMRYGLDDGLTPRTRTFWESAPSEFASSSMGPPTRTRGHRGATSVELSELFTREPLQSPRVRESASRSQLRENNWHIGSDAAFIHPPTANGVDYSQNLVPYDQPHLSHRPSTTPSYSSYSFNSASIHEIPSPPPSDEIHAAQPQYPTVGSASLNLASRRKGRPQALSLLSKIRPHTAHAPSLSAISNANSQSSGFSHEEQTPTQASFDGQNASYSINRPYEDQSYGLVGMDQSGGYQIGQDQGPSSGNSMVFDDEWRPKVDYIPFVEAPWFIQ